MIRQLASLQELQCPDFTRRMEHINPIGRESRLKEYTTCSRTWEYPWVWSHLEAYKARKLCVLDIGSETSPFPWFLAAQGFRVVLSDATANHWRAWLRASRRLGVACRKPILDARNLDIATATVEHRRHI
jgi:hypothetical protein